MPVPFVIRNAQIGDLDALTALMYEYIVDFFQRPWPPVERVHALIRTCLDAKEGIQFVAEQDGGLVGFATVYFTYSTLAAQKATIMNDLYVVQAVRGTGVAAALFGACHRFTQANGYAFMTWETASDNHRAQRFYQKQGGNRGKNLTYWI